GLHINWKVMGISAGVAVLGGGLAFLFNKLAKDATSDRPEKGTLTKPDDYQDNYDKAGKYQTLRAVSYGIIGLGVVGIGLSFVF
ncbi:MAG: hypothetical protein MJY98_12450, partial [Fibrobacter sp.]|nr:hypothetical protein [Fibrobacter sp.]